MDSALLISQNVKLIIMFRKQDGVPGEPAESPSFAWFLINRNRNE